MNAAERFLERLEAVRQTGPDRWMARCPAHDDRNPSLSVTIGNEGRVLVKCFAECPVEEIVKAVNFDLSDLFVSNGDGRPVTDAEYAYTDDAGKVLFQVVRFWPKGFRQRRPDGAGGWIWNLDGVRVVLYRLPKVRAAIEAGEPVLVVEGEKDVHAVEKRGKVATCNPGGAGKWRPEYSEALRGAKVAVIADRDGAGRKHAAEVAKSLEGVAKSVKLFEPAEGKDLSDHLAAGLGLSDLIEANPNKPEPKADPPLSRLINFDGIEARAIKWAWRDRIALGKLTALSGRPKIGKGLLYVHLIADLTRGRLEGDLSGPRRAIIVTTEDDPADTLKPRLMAAGADLSRVSMFQMGTPDEPGVFTVPKDADELRCRVAESEAGLVVIDPLMEFLDQRTNPYLPKDSRQALASVRAIAREHLCAILAIYHLNKTRSSDVWMRNEGAAAFTQVIRSGLTLGADPVDPDGTDGDQRVLAVNGTNIAKIAPSLLYRIDTHSVSGPEEPIQTARITPIGESTATSADLLGGWGDDDTHERDEATEFLRAELEDGPRPATEVTKAAKAADIGSGSLRRAKRELGVKKQREGFGRGGKWLWELPVPIGDGPLGTDDVPEKPSPMTPMGSRAESEAPKGGQIPIGDGSRDDDPFDADAEEKRIARKFGGV